MSTPTGPRQLRASRKMCRSAQETDPNECRRYRKTVSSVLPELTAEGYLAEDSISVNAITGGGITVTTRRFLEESLWSYGEDDLVLRVKSV